jgi:hypothetical protein
MIQAPGFTDKQYTRLERLAMDMHSSLIQKFVNYGRNFFFNIGPQIGERAQAIATFALCGFANPVNIYFVIISGKKLLFPVRIDHFRKHLLLINSDKILTFLVRIYHFR